MIRALLELIVVVIVIRTIWKLVGGLMLGLSGRQTRAPRTPQRGVQMVRDPVCGTFVVPATAVVLNDGSRQLYFCSAGCRDQYRARTA